MQTSIVDGDADTLRSASELVIEARANLESAIAEEAAVREAALEQTNQNVASNTASIQTNTRSIASNSNAIASNRSAISANAANIANNSKRISAESAKTAASINAIASAPQNGVGVALGVSNGSQAIAIGVKKMLNNRTQLTATLSADSTGSVTAGVGFGWTF